MYKVTRINRWFTIVIHVCMCYIPSRRHWFHLICSNVTFVNLVLASVICRALFPICTCPKVTFTKLKYVWYQWMLYMKYFFPICTILLAFSCQWSGLVQQFLNQHMHIYAYGWRLSACRYVCVIWNGFIILSPIHYRSMDIVLFLRRTMPWLIFDWVLCEWPLCSLFQKDHWNNYN